jgi:hypothetical protein
LKNLLLRATRNWFVRRSVIALASIALLMTNTALGGITYINVIDSTGSYSGFFGGPINNQGQLAFQAGTTSVEGIYTSNGTTMTTIAQGSAFTTFFAPTSINDNGTVAFVAVNSHDVTSLYTGNGGALTTIASEGPTFSALYGGSINNAGTVAFVGPSSSSTGSGVYTGNGGALTTVASTGSIYSGFGSYPSINQSGTVLFDAGLTGGGAGLFAVNGHTTTTIYESSTIQTSNGAINNAGTAVFALQNNSGFSGIYTGNGGTPTLIASTNGTDFAGFQQNPSDINNHGQVAFLAYLTGGGTEILFGTAGNLESVIATGDTLFGSTVTYLAIDNFGLNDNGQVAFFYILQNGVSGLAIANAVSVPEPGSFILAAMGLAGVLSVMGWTRLRRN